MEELKNVAAHPQQVVNEGKRNQARLKRQCEKAFVAGLVEKHGLRFLHVRDYALMDGDEVGVTPNGGMTIAYASKHKNGKVISVATALCNPSDAYCKHEGRLHAAQAYDNCRRITLSKPNRDISVATFLLLAFDPIRALSNT